MSLENLSLFSSLEEPVSKTPAERLGILVLGPNASGKTTATNMAMDGLRTSVQIENLDNGSKFKVKMAVLEPMLRDIWYGPSDVLVIEGTRAGTIISRLIQQGPLGRGTVRPIELVLTETDPETMRQHILSRCQRSGQVFRGEYWQGPRLIAHCYRQAREIARHFQGVPVSRFPIGVDYSGHSELVAYLRARVQKCLE